MRRILLIAFVILLIPCILALMSYGVWTRYRPVSHYLSDLRSTVAVNLGTDSGRGNLLAVQPELYPADYQNPRRLYLKLAAALDKARSAGLINDKTVVVLPEHIGTWLIIVGEKDDVYREDMLGDAMGWLTVSNPAIYLRTLFSSQGNNPFIDALMRMKAEQTARQYQLLFGELAREYQVTLVAGSVVLPNPQVRNGQLHSDKGPLNNVSLVFGKDGNLLAGPLRKIYPQHTEGELVAGGSLQQLQVVETPAGRLGVLIGTDSWLPEAYARLREQHVDFIAVPAFENGNRRWQRSARKYRIDGEKTRWSILPRQVTQGEAWQRLGLPAHLQDSGATAAVLVFARGRLWNMGTNGLSQGLSASTRQQVPDQPGTQIINVWL